MVDKLVVDMKEDDRKIFEVLLIIVYIYVSNGLGSLIC